MSIKKTKVKRAAVKRAPRPPGSRTSRDRQLPGDLPAARVIERMIRVNHAGEFGAQRIYEGQLSVLGRGPTGDKLRHMAAQEQKHLAAFERLMKDRAVRPTVLHPLWHVAGYALGAVTASLGEKAAMACTVAVEEVIDEHYQKQLGRLGKNEAPLARLIARFRQEEIEHRDIGRDHGAEDLSYYTLLRRLVRAGSKSAIWLSERI